MPDVCCLDAFWNADTGTIKAVWVLFASTVKFRSLAKCRIACTEVLRGLEGMVCHNAESADKECDSGATWLMEALKCDRVGGRLPALSVADWLPS